MPIVLNRKLSCKFEKWHNLHVVLKRKCTRQNHLKGICLYCHLEVIVVATKKKMHKAAANQHLDNHSLNGLVIRLRSEENNKYMGYFGNKIFWKEAIWNNQSRWKGNFDVDVMAIDWRSSAVLKWFWMGSSSGLWCKHQSVFCIVIQGYS